MQAQGKPDRIAEYEVIRSLGRGVMGEVFLGRKGNIAHAIKILDNRVAQKLDCAHRFEQEIVHENVCQYLAVRFEPQYKHYFVMDYLEVRPITGRSVRRQGHAAIVELFLKVCNGLAHMHSRGVVHANIKGSNILVRRQDETLQPIISDAGIGYIFDLQYFKGHVFKAAMPYMSPEYIAYVTSSEVKPTLPKDITAASDVYSLAVVLCEALTGRPVYEDEDMVDLNALVKAKQEKRFRLVGVNHPWAAVDFVKLDELIGKSLSPDVSKRPQSAHEFAQGLQAARLETAV